MSGGLVPVWLAAYCYSGWCDERAEEFALTLLLYCGTELRFSAAKKMDSYAELCILK